jgi:glucose/arabinose dehydrogenase
MPKEKIVRPTRMPLAARAAILALALVPVIGIELTSARDVVVSARPPYGPEFDASKITISFSRVARNLSQPLFVTHAADSSGRLFIVEKGGRIKILKNGTVLPTPFLNISTKVSTGSEQGLLGLAFHPDYASNGKFYVDYTNRAGDTVIAEYENSVPSDNVAGTAERVLMNIGQPYSNHNGGMVAFGPDRYLYIGMGDGGSGGDPGNRAQNIGTWLGKILRIDVSDPPGPAQYRIPPGNPFVGVNGLDEIWATGVRNPWRFSFDRLTGDLWIGDVGQNRYEEIDRSTAPDAGRKLNYGWKVLEAKHCYPSGNSCRKTGKTMPMAEYSHSLGCSVTGGYVYRGLDDHGLVGGYLFGDYCSGRIWALKAMGPASQTPVLMADTSFLISSFGEGQDGKLYLTNIGAGEVWQVVSQYK